jgi:rRNA-processing protein FCF1
MEKKPPRKVILDTNFLLVPLQFNLDIFKVLERLLEAPHDVMVSTSIISELKRLAKNRGRQGAAARFGLKLVEIRKGLDKLKVVKGTSPVDDWIVEYASENRALVCTNDVILKKKLKAKGVKIIVLRTKTRLDFE